MEISALPETPQSIWGHRLRQTVRNALLRRGFDIDLIDDPEVRSPEGQTLPQNVLLPDDDNLDAAESAEDALHWAQDVHMWPKMFLQDIPSHRPGICKLCTRTMTNITRHHLHPRVGRASERRPLPGMDQCSKKYLNMKIDLCRPCHSMIHHIIPNDLMSDSYYSLSLLTSHPRVQAWISWVRRQRIPSPRPPGQPAPPRVLRPVKKPKGIQLKLGKAQKRKSNQERSVLNIALVIKIQSALAKLWSDSGNEIPRSLGDQPALQRKLSDLAGVNLIRLKNIRKVMAVEPKYREWYEWAFPGAVASRLNDGPAQHTRLAAEKEEKKAKEEMTLKIKEALEKIWHDTSNDFPRFPVGRNSRDKALREAVKGCTGSSQVKNKELQRIMQLDAKYRTWFEWTYPKAIWNEPGQRATRSGCVYFRMPTDNVDDGDDDDDNRHHDGAEFYSTGIGTGSRADPIILDLTDDERGAAIPNGRGNIDVYPCDRTFIDLTMDGENSEAVFQAQQADRGGDVQPAFFFDLGGGHTRDGGFLNA